MVQFCAYFIESACRIKRKNGPQTKMRQEMTDRAVEETLAALRHRRMVLPAALFLAGHRPMAFAIGQLLLVFQPLAALLGGDGIGAWARLLSHPAGPAALGDRLTELIDEEENALLDRGSES